MAAGLITLNLAHRDGGLLVYSPTVVVGGLVTGALFAGVAAAGALVSLHTLTVKEASQKMMLGTAVLAALYGLIGLLPGETRAAVVVTLSGVSTTAMVLVAAVVLAVIDAGFIAAAVSRFQCARLILD